MAKTNDRLKIKQIYIHPIRFNKKCVELKKYDINMPSTWVLNFKNHLQTCLIDTMELTPSYKLYIVNHVMILLVDLNALTVPKIDLN